MRILLRAALATLWLVHGMARAGDPSVIAWSHRPPAPTSGQAVTISVETTGRPASLVLECQVVDPGRYLELNSPAFLTKWVPTPMTLKTARTDRATFEATLPGSQQIHRRLVRYRFRGSDATGHTFVFPATNDPSPNFAYFVYDGVPAWTGAIQPGSREARLSAPVTFGANVMQRVQSYHLLATARAIENITWKEQDGGKEYKYTGTLVAHGVVYDHVRLRARGGVWRYALGKNMWKFDLPKGDPLQARDDYGQLHPVPWGKVNLRACIQQGDYGYRGEQGMFESVGFRLFNLAGVPAPLTHWIQLRIITSPDEAPADQYRGDFWGLYLAFEDVDGRFLKSHQLPDGNVYKMEGGGGTRSHQGAGAVTNQADLDAFLRAYNGAPQSESWWRSHLELAEYYSYRSICECIHHYDIAEGKNYYYYLNPTNSRWAVIPWDIDLTWADNMYGSGEEPFKRRVLNRPSFRVEYQNRLREIRDLLFNPGETSRLIDECAAIIADPAGGPSPVDADRAKWDFHPAMAIGGKAGQGLFYQVAPGRSFRGMVQLMKRYVEQRAAWIDRYLLTDQDVPAAPRIVYTGPAGYPGGTLTFRVSDGQATGSASAVQWRLAEIASPLMKTGRPIAPGRYEITALWESGDLANSTAAVTVPARVVAAGNTYRVRARVKDAAGRCSHWSQPVEFVASGKKEPGARL